MPSNASCQYVSTTTMTAPAEAEAMSTVRTSPGRAIIVRISPTAASRRDRAEPGRGASGGKSASAPASAAAQATMTHEISSV